MARCFLKSLALGNCIILYSIVVSCGTDGGRNSEAIIITTKYPITAGKEASMPKAPPVIKVESDDSV
jgi:hypothetical protein